jgi:hypothetical protein
MKTQFADDLKRLLEIKKELLAKLLDTVKRAEGLLAKDDIEGFNGEMDQCADFMSMADDLEKSAAGLRQQIPDIQQQPEIIRLQGDIAYIAEQVGQLRRECSDLAQQKLDGFSQQIRVIRHSKKIDGYANQFQSRDAFFIDAKK